ncbi:MAG: hypothetical protein JNL58_02895 [Planctomyces sp.]|nr:hypothetical protein [Planctomyces sp.]
MFDYSSWFDRAARYLETLKVLPGEIIFAGSICPPISHEEVDRLANRSRLPIPMEMRQLWTEGASHSNLTYSWESIPSTLRRQVAVASCDRFNDVIWGGPEFLSPKEIVELSHDFPDWAKGMRPDNPKDARIWDHSLPLIPVGNGDYVGLYVEVEKAYCPVVYLCHEASGGSCVIAHSLEEFLASWEELCYVGIDFLMTYRSPESDLLATSEHLIRVEMLSSLLRGKERDDLVVPSMVTSEQDWLTARSPDRLLKWLEENGSLQERKTRLYCCACCRRVWNQLGASGQHAVEVSELYADGRANDQELSEARAQLSGGIDLSEHVNERFFDAMKAISERYKNGANDQELTEDLAQLSDGIDLSEHVNERFLDGLNAISEPYENGANDQELTEDPDQQSDEIDLSEYLNNGFINALNSIGEFQRREGIMQGAAYAAVDALWYISEQIVQHLDDPHVEKERRAHAEIVRHIFGNPFRTVVKPINLNDNLRHLAQCVYEGEELSFQLSSALKEAGYVELAQHFEIPMHPRGCWALELLLGDD